MRFSHVVGLKFDLIVDGAYMKSNESCLSERKSLGLQGLDTNHGYSTSLVTYAALYSILGKNYDMGWVPGTSSQSRRNDLFGTRHRHQTPAL